MKLVLIVDCPLARQYTGDLTCVDDGWAAKLVPIIEASIIFRITTE